MTAEFSIVEDKEPPVITIIGERLQDGGENEYRVPITFIVTDNARLKTVNGSDVGNGIVMRVENSIGSKGDYTITATDYSDNK